MQNNAISIVDTHCHLDVTDFDHDRHTVLKQARNSGVCGIIIPGIVATRWQQLLTLCSREIDLFPALGIHPLFLNQSQNEDLEQLEKLVVKSKPIAIGEIGLDYALKPFDKERQQFFFQQQLEVAEKHDLPVIIHARKSHDDIIASLTKSGVRCGIIHAFSGSIQQAHQYINLGFKLGFGGMLTFERSTKLRRLAEALPLNAIVLETDSPDMTVASHRGERNSPEYLPEVLEALAKIKNQEIDHIADETTKNALSLFQCAELDTLVRQHQIAEKKTAT